jgi:DNA-binding response OmpR family regulator
MKRKITVIDDDVDLRNLLKIGLLAEGFEVQLFPNGEEFFSNLDSNDPAHLYVIDINLGGISGYDICSHLKTNIETRNSIVILISANPELPEHATNVAADEYIFKPFLQKDLMQRISALLVR